MTRDSFDRELNNLRSSVLTMGSEVELNLGKVAEALVKRNAILAERLIEFDDRVNSQRIDLVMKSLVLIATQQPMATDLRFIATVIEIAGELERMHDYVKGIAKTSLELGPDEADAAARCARGRPRGARVTGFRRRAGRGRTIA